MGLPAENPDYDFKRDPEVMEVLAKCSVSTKTFSRLFLEDSFYAPFCSIHDTIFKAIDDPKIKKIVIAAPRGIGKTTIMRALAMKSILFRQKRFVCYIGKSEGHAMMQTESIKRTLIGDKRIREFFGNIKTNEKIAGMDEEFSKKGWVANGWTVIIPRGSGQQVRGLLWGNYRPDLFIVDDLEDKMNIKNETIRAERYEWFYTDVLKAIPQITSSKYARQDYKVIYIDTVKHQDSLIEHLMEDPSFAHIRLPVCDEDYKTLAPDFMPQNELDAELEHHRLHKTMDFFAMERLCQSVSAEDLTFSPELFQYYSEADLGFVERLRGGFIENVVLIDPAKTAKMQNAQSGIVVWGVDVESGAMYLREARGEFYHPDELYADAIKTCKRYNSRVLGVETTGLDEFIKHPLKDEMVSNGLFFEPIWLSARKGKGELAGEEGGKTGRVGALGSYYRRGLIFHNKVGCGAYEQQLLSYPKPRRWDIIDAAAYIIQALEEGMRYFQPPEDKEETFASVEAEYAELQDEPADSDWRVI